MFSVCYLFGLALFVWVNSGGACVVTHNYCVRHSHSRDCTFKINSSGLRQFRFELMCEYHSFVWKWRVKLTRPISVSCLIIYILHNILVLSQFLSIKGESRNGWPKAVILLVITDIFLCLC